MTEERQSGVGGSRRQSAIGSRQSVQVQGASLPTRITSNRDLRVCRFAVELTVECCRATGRFPEDEAYGLTSQIRRSSTSISASIAEGYGRDSRGSYLHFPRIAQGSLKELETHIIVATRLDLFDTSTEAKLLSDADDIGQMLRSLIRKLEAEGVA